MGGEADATNSSGSVDRPGIKYAYDADSPCAGTSSPSFQVTGTCHVHAGARERRDAYLGDRLRCIGKAGEQDRMVSFTPSGGDLWPSPTRTSWF